MSKTVNPLRYVGRVEGISKRDGTRGFKVTHHWIVWVRLALVVIAVGLVSGFTAALIDYPPGVMIGALGIGYAAWRYWVIKNDFLIVTRQAVYHNHIRPWKFEIDTDVTKMKTIIQSQILPEGKNLIGDKKVVIITAGEAANLTYRHAAGGNTMSRAVNEFSS